MAVWDTSRGKRWQVTDRMGSDVVLGFPLAIDRIWFSAGAAAVCADPLTSSPYSIELEVSWLRNREGELATANGTPELGAGESNGSSPPGSAGNSGNVPSGRTEDRRGGSRMCWSGRG